MLCLLHTTFGMFGYLCYCHLPISFEQSGPSPLISLMNNTFCLQSCCSQFFFCCFLHLSLQTLETFVRENYGRSAVTAILKPPCLAPTIIPRSESLRSHFFPLLKFWIEKQVNLLITSACVYAISCCHVIGRLNICTNKLVCRCT